MSKLDKIIGELLVSTPAQREILLSVLDCYDFNGNTNVILTSMKSLKSDFEFADLYLTFKENKSELISMCMDEYLKSV